MDSNKTRERRKRVQAKNKAAFTEILGDPFREIDGTYTTLQSRSSVGCIEEKFGEVIGTIDSCKPSLSDFFCDVQNVLRDALEPEWVQRFIKMYIFGDTTSIPKPVRFKMEQQIGQLFRARGIAPVKRYFTVNK